jgi:hypothetical protein
MPRLNKDRIRISFHLSRRELEAVDERAHAVRWTRAEMLRHMLDYAHLHMPKH